MLANRRLGVCMSVVLENASEVATGGGKEDFASTNVVGSQFQHHVITIPCPDFKLSDGTEVPQARLGGRFYGTHGNKLTLLSGGLSAASILMPQDNLPETCQGVGWAKHFIGGHGSFGDYPLHLDKDFIFAIDHFGGNAPLAGVSSTTTGEELGDLWNRVRLSDGVNLAAQALKSNGIDKIHAVVGASLGGGQAVEWLFQDQLPVRKIVDFSGMLGMNDSPKEVFAIARDLLNPSFKVSDVVARINGDERNPGYLTSAFGMTASLYRGFGEAVSIVRNKVASLNHDSTDTQKMEALRSLHLLPFVGENFFDSKFYGDSISSEGENPLIRMEKWFEDKSSSYARSFSPQALRCLSHQITSYDGHTAAEFAQQLIDKDVCYMRIVDRCDQLFSSLSALYFLLDVKKYLQMHNQEHRLVVASTANVNFGHDSFMRPQGVAEQVCQFLDS